MLKAVIFDMDGLLIDSEPIWQKSEIEIFSKLGVPLTREMCMQTMGLRLDEVIEHWHKRFPWENKPHKEVEKEVVDTVIRYILSEGKAMEGVIETLEFFKAINYKVALASSSCFDIIHAVVDKLGIREYFQVIHSAEKEEYGKPHPAIYISTAHLLGVKPVECIAFEDSFNGLIAAKAARMKAVAVPDAVHFNQARFDFADLKIRSLKEFSNEKLKQLDS
ncbi:MAG: hexitol phosphatase HxpB [Cytophagaceae bacterium]